MPEEVKLIRWKPFPYNILFVTQRWDMFCNFANGIAVFSFSFSVLQYAAYNFELAYSLCKGERSAASKLISDSPEQIQKMHVVESASLFCERASQKKEHKTEWYHGRLWAQSRQPASRLSQHSRKRVHYSRKSPKCAHALFLLSSFSQWNYECCERNMQQQQRPVSFITQGSPAQTLPNAHVINVKVVGCFCAAQNVWCGSVINRDDVSTKPLAGHLVPPYISAGGWFVMRRPRSSPYKFLFAAGAPPPGPNLLFARAANAN